jgi:hypothetical protein
MEAFYDRSILGDIEFYELFGEHERVKALKKMFKAQKERLMRGEVKRDYKHDREKRHSILEGVLVAAGWDTQGNISQASLYTHSGEDIILEHRFGLKKFKPFINERVRVSGLENLDSDDGRKMIVRRISRVLDRKYPLLPVPEEQMVTHAGG